MTDTKTYDLIVVGSGPGGYVAAIRAAQLNLKTAIVERDKLGGICLNWGCIPSKALLTNARIYHEIKRAEKWGLTIGEVHFDMSKIIGRSREVSENISKGVAYLMKKNQINVIKGEAKFRNPHELSIATKDGDEEQILQANHIVIATGARARTLPGVEVDGEKIITYKQALLLEDIPGSMLIIGAGAIGVEFAYFYNSFDAEVTIIEMEETLLPIEDHEISQELGKSFKHQGIKTLLRSKVHSAEAQDDGVVVSVEEKDGKQKELKTDVVLNAVGVVANVEHLGLDDLGVQIEKGSIKVNQWYETNVEGVYAIGDVIGPPWLAHVASHEGIICVEKIAGAKTHPLDYGTIPNCTYCQPQVASVGITERQAKEQGHRVKVGKFPFHVLGKARASQSTEGFVKLVFAESHGELLGAHIIGEEATEMIAELVMAKALESTYEGLLRTVHAHPTLSEAVMEAAGMAFGEQIHL